MEDKNFIENFDLTEKDLAAIAAREITLEKVKHQIEQIKKGTKYVHLSKPCLIGNGIINIKDDEKSG